MSEERPPGDLFQPIATGRMSAVIVEQIRGLIREGRLRAGDRLPPERTLAQQFGVSRVTVRDAFRSLQSAGLIEVRVGANGGAVITQPSGVRISERLGDMMLLDALEAAEVTESRLVLEVAIIDLVCERATDEDIAALGEICARSDAAIEAGTYSMDLSTEFHIRLAECTHNRALDLIVRSFRDAVRESLFRARSIAPVMGLEGVREHHDIVAAVRAGDAARARAVLAPHLLRTAERLRAALRAGTDPADQG